MLGSTLRQFSAIWTVVFSDSYANVPRIQGSVRSRSFPGDSAKQVSICYDTKKKRMLF